MNIDMIINLIQINIISMELLKRNMSIIEDKNSDEYLNLESVMNAMEIQNNVLAGVGSKLHLMDWMESF